MFPTVDGEVGEKKPSLILSEANHPTPNLHWLDIWRNSYWNESKRILLLMTHFSYLTRIIWENMLFYCVCLEARERTLHWNPMFLCCWQRLGRRLWLAGRRIASQGSRCRCMRRTSTVLSTKSRVQQPCPRKGKAVNMLGFVPSLSCILVLLCVICSLWSPGWPEICPSLHVLGLLACTTTFLLMS